MNDLSPKQEQVLSEVREWVLENNFDPLGKWDDYDLLRFCRARKFVIADVKLMIGNNFSWRKENQMDTILLNFQFPELDAVKQHYPLGYHGVDKLGHPIVIQKMGSFDTDKIFQLTTQEKMLEYNRFWQEQTFRLRFPAASAFANKRIDSLILINDLNGLSLSQFNRAMLNLIRGAAIQGSDYFPESLKASYIINAPMSFTAIYGLVKHFFEEDTRAKIVILGSDYAPALLNAIEASQLPQQFGGTCTCSDLGGDCMRSDKGPWLDYEVDWPKGIRSKAKLQIQIDHAPELSLSGNSSYLDISGDTPNYIREIPKSRTRISPGFLRSLTA